MQGKPNSKYKPIAELTVLAIISLMLATFAGMIDTPIFVIADDMYAAYGNELLCNTILTGPSIVALFASLAGIPLMRRFSKKTIMIGVTTFAAICGIGELLLVDSVYAMLVLRLLGGIPMGLGLLTVVAVVNEAYRNNDKKRSFFIGMTNGCSSLVGAAVQFAAGLFAVAGWCNALKLYWLYLPILVLVIIFVPRTAPEGNSSNEENAVVQENADDNKPFPLLPFIALLASEFVFAVVFMFMCSQNSFLISEFGLDSLMGGSYVGTFNSVLTIATGVVAFFSGPLLVKLKRALMPICYALTGIGFLIAMICHNGAGFMAAGILVAMGYAISFPCFQIRAAQIVPVRMESSALTIVLCVQFIGNALSSYIVSALMAIFGTDARSEILIVFVILYAVGLILSIILAARAMMKKN